MSESTTHTNAACELVLDYVYGELDEARKRTFDEHLPTCARCQAEVASFGRVRTATKRVLPAQEPTASLAGALHAQLMHAAAQRKPKRGVLLSFPRRIVEHPALSAAAMFVIVGGAIAINWSRGKLEMPAPESVAATQTAAPVPEEDKAAKLQPQTAEPVPVGKAKEEAAPEYKTAFAKGGGGAAKDATKIALETDTGTFDVQRSAAHRASNAAAPAPARKSEMPAKMKNIVADKKAGKRDSLAGGVGVMPSSDESEGAGLDSASGGVVGGAGPRVATGAKSSAPGDVAHGAYDDQANRPAQTRGYVAAAPSSPVPQSAAPPAATMPAPEVAMPMPSTRAQTTVQKPAGASRSFDAVRKQADEYAKSNRCDEAIKLYQELEKSGQYISPTERVGWVRCLTQRGRQEEAQQRLDELKAEKRVTNGQIQDAERELNDSRRRVEPKKKAKKSPAANDRAVQSEQLQRAAEPAPPPASPPDATHTKVDPKQSY